jgi:hypothetical protein
LIAASTCAIIAGVTIPLASVNKKHDATTDLQKTLRSYYTNQMVDGAVTDTLSAAGQKLTYYLQTNKHYSENTANILATRECGKILQKYNDFCAVHKKQITSNKTISADDETSWNIQRYDFLQDQVSQYGIHPLNLHYYDDVVLPMEQKG